VKRWLLWNMRCLRGRRCADVIAETKLAVGIEYTCASCGTLYYWNSRTRERTRVE
jgi:phage FluMu protein Com